MKNEIRSLSSKANCITRRVALNILTLLTALTAVPYPLLSQVQGSELGPPSMNSDRTLRSKHDLRCAPAPCVLPNTQVSTDEANTTILAVNPENSHKLLSGTLGGYGYVTTYGSDNGGSSWYSGENRLGYAGPTLAYGVSGAAYAAGSYDADVFIEATQDNGQTWTRGTVAVTPLFAGGSSITPWLTIDNSNTSQYSGRIYIATTQLDNPQVQSRIAVSHSADGGETWSLSGVDRVQVKPELDYYSRVAVSLDGTVYVAWQRCEALGKHVNCGGTKAHMWLSKSIDGGVTWSSPTRIVAVQLAPDSCQCSFFGNLPHTQVAMANPPLLAVDNSQGPYSGNLYVGVYNWTGKQMKVQILTSQDGGVSWGSPVEVAGRSRNDEFFPGLSVSLSGVVGVSWLDRRNDPQNALYQPFAAISTDGGRSFGKNHRLSHQMSSPYDAPQGGMGDYTGNAWAGETLYAAWPDTRYGLSQDFMGGFRTK